MTMTPLSHPDSLILHWHTTQDDWHAWHTMASERGWVCAARTAPLADLPTVWDIPPDPIAAWDTHPDHARTLCERLCALSHAAQRPMLMGHTHIGAWVRAGHPARFAAVRVLIWGLRIAAIPIHWIWIGTADDDAVVRRHLPDVAMMLETAPCSTSYQQPALFAVPPAASPSLPEPSAGPLRAVLRSARIIAMRRNTPALIHWYERWHDLGERVHRLLETTNDPDLLDLANHIRESLAVSGMCHAAAYTACLHRLRAYEPILDRSCSHARGS